MRAADINTNQTSLLLLEAGRVNDDTREEEGQDSSPVEISSVYTKYTKPSKAETSDDHSSVTAAALSTK